MTTAALGSRSLAARGLRGRVLGRAPGLRPRRLWCRWSREAGLRLREGEELDDGQRIPGQWGRAWARLALPVVCGSRPTRSLTLRGPLLWSRAPGRERSKPPPLFLLLPPAMHGGWATFLPLPLRGFRKCLVPRAAVSWDEGTQGDKCSHHGAHRASFSLCLSFHIGEVAEVLRLSLLERAGQLFTIPWVLSSGGLPGRGETRASCTVGTPVLGWQGHRLGPVDPHSGCVCTALQKPACEHCGAPLRQKVLRVEPLGHLAPHSLPAGVTQDVGSQGPGRWNRV